jgi:hypothetical protein
MLKDNLKFGLLLGFIAPIVGMVLYYLIQFKNVITFREFVHIILVQRTLLTALVSVSLVANAAIFTLYINKRLDQTAKGIFIATCIYAMASLIWKFLL